MAEITIYGIKNCDTMKKAFAWLDARGVDYSFHDYKKQGVDADVLRAAVAQHGWENVINKRGTTWRKLPEAVRDGMDETLAIETAIEHPSALKRPILVRNGEIYLGFAQDDYENFLG